MTNVFYAGNHGLMGCAQQSHDSVGQALAIAFARFCELDRGPGDQQYNRVFAVDQAQFLQRVLKRRRDGRDILRAKRLPFQEGTNRHNSNPPNPGCVLILQARGLRERETTKSKRK